MNLCYILCILVLAISGFATAQDGDVVWQNYNDTTCKDPQPTVYGPCWKRSGGYGSYYWRYYAIDGAVFEAQCGEADTLCEKCVNGFHWGEFVDTCYTYGKDTYFYTIKNPTGDKKIL